ncbi:MAG: HPF/RaiA family ribosome-associated protein [Planctomycetota bacterium]
MESPVQIVFQDLDRSEAIEARVHEKIAWLEKFFDRITRARVVIARPHRHQQNGERWSVHIQLGVPGTELVVDRDPSDPAHEDIEVALRDAFQAARRQLQDYERRNLRGQVKAHDLPPEGHIVRLFPGEGYGFIESVLGTEVYFHENAVAGKSFADLSVGDLVRYTEELGEKGPQASVVQTL